jgi:hypothetical protein
MALAVLAGCPANAETPSAWTLDVESGRAYCGYNDVRIPGDTGADLSLTEDLSTDPTTFIRLRATRAFADRHNVSALVAPLRLEGRGWVDRPVRFDDALFPPGTELKSLYRFDSYRLTYRYDFSRGARFRAGLGITAKVRDAAIHLDGGGLTAEKANTGLVPLINFHAEWRPGDRMSLVLDGDALAAPQGRAEDVLGAIQWRVDPAVSIKAGYRILEGGADNDEVYSFALIHYAVLGATIRF